MMDVESMVTVLHGRGAMTRFEDDELRELVAACELNPVQAKAALWIAGDVRSHAYILVNGRLERSTKTHTGRVTQQHSEPGTILSISSLVNPWAYHGSCYALERTELLALSRAKFIELFDARADVAYKLVDAIGEYLVADMRKANERLQEVFGRPAETLMMLRRRIREDSKA